MENQIEKDMISIFTQSVSSNFEDVKYSEEKINNLYNDSNKEEYIRILLKLIMYPYNENNENKNVYDSTLNRNVKVSMLISIKNFIKKSIHSNLENMELSTDMCIFIKHICLHVLLDINNEDIKSLQKYFFEILVNLLEFNICDDYDYLLFYIIILYINDYNYIDLVHIFNNEEKKKNQDAFKIIECIMLYIQNKEIFQNINQHNFFMEYNKILQNLETIKNIIINRNNSLNDDIINYINNTKRIYKSGDKYNLFMLNDALLYNISPEGGVPTLNNHNNNHNHNQNNNNNNNNQNNNNYNNNNYNSPNQEQCDDIKTKQYVKDNVENNKKIDEQQNCCKESYNEDKEKNNHNCIDGIYTEDIITKKKKCNNDNITEEVENMNVQNLESLQNDGNGVIELGCGLGQISKYLFSKYKNMTGIEIDSRALSIISRTMPGFDFIHDDVLQINYKELSINKKTKLTIIGNLPFYITSQILFCLLDFHKYIEQAIVTIQYEVGERIVAKPNQKNYSILSILFHLFTYPYLLFKIPSKAFYPVPKVQAAVMKIIFKNHESYYKHINCNLLFLKKILKYSFQQRRKKLKSSLKNLLIQYNIPKLPEQFINLRPQQLYPYQFVELTNLLFPLQNYPFNPNIHTKVWRKKKHGD